MAVVYGAIVPSSIPRKGVDGGVYGQTVHVGGVPVGTDVDACWEGVARAVEEVANLVVEAHGGGGRETCGQATVHVVGTVLIRDVAVLIGRRLASSHAFVSVLGGPDRLPLLL